MGLVQLHLESVLNGFVDGLLATIKRSTQEKLATLKFSWRLPEPSNGISRRALIGPDKPVKQRFIGWFKTYLQPVGPLVSQNNAQCDKAVLIIHPLKLSNRTPRIT
jgi:hypothetical protein